MTIKASIGVCDVMVSSAAARPVCAAVSLARNEDHEMRDLSKAELDHLIEGDDCPICGAVLYEGPAAGMCVNLICEERHRFNFCGMTGQYIGIDNDATFGPMK